MSDNEDATGEPQEPIGGSEDVSALVGGPEDVAAEPESPSEQTSADSPPEEPVTDSQQEEAAATEEEPPKESSAEPEEPPSQPQEEQVEAQTPAEPEDKPEEPEAKSEEPEAKEPETKAEEPETKPEEPEAKPEEPEAKPEEPAVVETAPEAVGNGEPAEEEPVKQKEEVVHKREKFWSVVPNEGVDLAIESSGLASTKPRTVGDMFAETYQIYPNRDALCYKEEGTWHPVSFAQYYANCLAAAKSFKKLGLQRFGAVAIIGFNAPEWFYSNLGAMFAGGLSAGIYTTNGPEACRFIASDCKANVIVVENQKQLDKILEIRDKLPDLKAIVQYKGKLSQDYENVYDWEQFMKLGEDIQNSEIEDGMKAQKPTDGALLVYTSGTTGDPKGVMLSHDNLTYTSLILYEHQHKAMNWTRGMVAKGITYLPLSHIAGQVADIYLPIYTAATIYFAQPDALKGSLRETLAEVKPTLFFGVPRVYEKFMEGLQQASSRVTGIKKKLGMWATGKGYQGNVNIQNKRPLPWGWTIANALVLDKVKERIGFQDAKVLLVGAAPVHRDVLEYFMKYNLPIMEIYGMSENSGPASCNTIHDWRLGSVGKCIVGTKLKLDNVDENGEGEICMYGRHVCMGYLNNEQKTREAIDDEGWLHSGDIGKIDKDGFVSITGRIKELIITSGGENIAPVPIEDRIKAAVPFLSNVMLIGDKRKYLSCVVTIKCVMDPDSGEPKDEVAPLAIPALKAVGCELTKPSEIAQQKVEGIMNAIMAGLEKANTNAISNAQRVQKFTILETDFSIPGGELGPTLKLKRRIVVKKYEAQIDAMYAEPPPKAAAKEEPKPAEEKPAEVNQEPAPPVEGEEVAKL